MVKKIIYLGLVLWGVACEPQYDVTPLGEITVEKREVGTDPFTGIKLYEGIDLEWSEAKETLVEVETDANMQKYVLVYILGNTLEIKQSIAANPLDSIPVKVRLSSSVLDEIVAWRGSTISLESPLENNQLYIELQKHATLKGDVHCEYLKTYVHDYSLIELTGKAKTSSWQMSEHSVAKCSELLSEETAIECDETSNISLGNP